MYMDITVTPVIAKLFESVLLSLYGDYLYTDQLQSGFKDNGCSDALLTVTESVIPAHVVQWSNHVGAMCSRA